MTKVIVPRSEAKSFCLSQQVISNSLTPLRGNPFSVIISTEVVVVAKYRCKALTRYGFLSNRFVKRLVCFLAIRTDLVCSLTARVLPWLLIYPQEIFFRFYLPTRDIVPLLSTHKRFCPASVLC